MATAPRPGIGARVDANEKASRLIEFRFRTPDGEGTEKHRLAPGNVPLGEKMALKAQAGMSWEQVTGRLGGSGIVEVAALVWLARRANGEPGLPWAVHAAEWDPTLDIEDIDTVVIADSDEGEPDPTVRARLLPSWPALSKHFGLHPWDVERLSVAELGVYLDALADMSGRSRG